LVSESAAPSPLSSLPPHDHSTSASTIRTKDRFMFAPFVATIEAP
jgi:hypothetical protein